MSNTLKRVRRSLNDKIKPDIPVSTLSSVSINIKDGKVKSKRFKSDRLSSAESLVSASVSYDCLSEDELSESDFEDHPYSMIPPKEKIGCKSIQNCLTENVSKKYRRTRDKCESKNAVMARLNRQKKKKYVENLELKNNKLESENVLLKEMLEKRLSETSTLKREIVNLRSVIKNSTEIGSLLKCIHENTNLPITSSLMKESSESVGEDTQVSGNISADKSPRNRSSMAVKLSPKGHSNLEEGNEKECIFSHNRNNQSETVDVSDMSSSLSPVVEDTIFNEIGIGSEKPNKMLLDWCINSEFGGSSSFFDPTLSSLDSKFDPEELLRCETPTKGLVTGTMSDDGFLFDDLNLGVGVCLHVSDKKVSLEFCESCNCKASFLNK